MPVRGSIRSSQRRFTAYVERRKKAAAEEVAAERVEARDKLEAKPRKRGFLRLFAFFWREVGRDRTLLMLALLSLSVATGLGLLIPYSTKITIDYILTDNPGPVGWPEWVPLAGETAAGRAAALLLLGLAMLAAGLVAAAVGLWGRWQATMIVKRLQVRLRRVAFEHAVQLPLTRVSDLKSGGVASILREDAGNAADLVFSMIYNPWRAVVQLVGTLVILALVDWRMLLGALILLPIVWLTHKTWIARLRPVYRDIRRTRQAIDAQAAESFGGIRVVRGFHRGQAEAARFSRDVNFMTRQEVLAWWWSRLIETAWQILVPVASVGVLMYGGWRVLERNLTVGDLMAFSAYVLMLLGPIEALVSSATNIQSNLAGYDRTLDLLEEPREFEAAAPGGTGLQPVSVLGSTGLQPVPAQPARLSHHEAAITFDRVAFAYPRGRPLRVTAMPDDDARNVEPPAANADPAADSADASPFLPPVLHDISFHARAGQTIALVGPSGSGKTTLTNLVARFYDPTAGRILLNGTDLRSIPLHDYRRLLGIVEQDVFLFDGTVAENIAYARRHATDADIRAAAQAANAHGFITELENGYDTLIGERGVRLSGGQKQRLAIARAVLADPKILILDEATSNLDSESERLIQRSLADLMRGRTSFVIAHRLSTIRHADRIIVLERGRIIETGTHDELVESAGRYADLLRLQLEGEPLVR